MKNNRKMRRIKFNYSILSFKCIDDESGTDPSHRPLHIWVTDISYKGIGIHVNQKFDKGDHIIMNLSDGLEKQEYQLSIRWCQGDTGNYRVGCAFSDLSERKLALLDRIMKEHNKSR